MRSLLLRENVLQIYRLTQRKITLKSIFFDESNFDTQNPSKPDTDWFTTGTTGGGLYINKTPLVVPGDDAYYKTFNDSEVLQKQKERQLR